MSYKSVEKEKEYQKKYHREYNQRPEVKEKRNAYNKANPEKVIQQRIRTYKNFLEKHGYQVIGLEDEA